MSPRRMRAVVILIAGTFLAGVAFAAWRWAAPGQIDQALPRPTVSVGLSGGSIVLRHRGVKQAEIRAGRVIVTTDLRYARLSDITQATFFDQGKAALWVTAREIVMDRQSSDLEIHGPVSIRSAEGQRLTAPEAKWQHALQRVIFPAGVHITFEGQDIRAGTLVVDTALRVFDLTEGVDIAFRLKSDTP